LQNEVTAQVARALAIKLLPSEQARLASARTVDPEAYEAYLKASQIYIKLTPEDLDTAERYCLLAMAKSPDFAPAYAVQSLVWTCRQQIGFTPPGEAGPKAKAAAQKAIELDETCSDAHYALALVLFTTDWDFAAADPEWNRAIELNPGNAEALAMHSQFLIMMGRPQEAMAQIERALKRDPYNVLVTGFHAVDLLMTRRYDEAIEAAQAALRAQPEAPAALTALWCAYAMKPMSRKKVIDLAKQYLMACYGDPNVANKLQESFAKAGYSAAMRAAAEALTARFEAGLALPMDIAYLYAAAGDNMKAMEWIERAFELRDPNMPYVEVWPLFIPLHHEPRFQEVLRQMGFPAGRA